MTDLLLTDVVRSSLLPLHEALLAVARTEHERFHGRVGGPGELLQLLAYDDAFAWLRPLSQLISALDDPETPPDAPAARAAVERLLTPGSAFHARYLEALQTAPAVVLAHAGVRRALGAVPVAA